MNRAHEQGTVAVPEPMVVFTVRLPAGLVERLRHHVTDSSRTLSSLVAEAINDVLARHGSVRRDG